MSSVLETKTQRGTKKNSSQPNLLTLGFGVLGGFL